MAKRAAAAPPRPSPAAGAVPAKRTPSAKRAAAARRAMAARRRGPRGQLLPRGTAPLGAPGGAPKPPSPPGSGGLDVLGHKVSTGTAVTVALGIGGALLAYYLYQQQAGSAGASVPSVSGGGSSGGGGGTPYPSSTPPLVSTHPLQRLPSGPKKGTKSPVPKHHPGPVRGKKPIKTVHHKVPTHRGPTGGPKPPHRTRHPVTTGRGHGQGGLSTGARVAIGRMHAHGIGGRIGPAHTRARTPATSVGIGTMHAHVSGPKLPHPTNHTYAGGGRFPQTHGPAPTGARPPHAGGLRSTARFTHPVQAHPVSGGALHRAAQARRPAPPRAPALPAQARRAAAGR